VKLRSMQPVAVALLAAALLGAWGQVAAEVSADHGTGRDVHTLLMDIVLGITDGADPIPAGWTPYRLTRRERLLNPSGEIRNDGRPDIVYRRASGWPVVVWAYNNGPDHDIAFAEWAGTGWSDIRFLTAGYADEVDPRVFLGPDGAMYVVWAVARDDPHLMFMRRGGASSLWNTPIRLTPFGDAPARPSIAFFAGAVWLTYETTLAADTTGTRYLVVRNLPLENADIRPEQHVIRTERQGDLDPIVHVGNGRLWVEWKHADDRFAWMMYRADTWGEVIPHPWKDTTWVGIESVRKEIQLLVMRPPMLAAGPNDDPGSAPQ